VLPLAQEGGDRNTVRELHFQKACTNVTLKFSIEIRIISPRKFVKDYLPALKFHNTEIAFTNVNKKETDPTLELHFEDGVVQKLDCSNISKDQVLEDLLKADKNFKAKEKVNLC